VTDDSERSPVFPSAIRRAYDLLVAGVSLDSIAGTWNAAGLPASPDGVPAPAGLRGTWTADRVRAVLSDRAHAGHATDELIWRRAADLLSAPPRHAEDPDRALLTAIATCGLCGRPVRSAVVSPGQTAYQCDGGGDRIHLARSTAPIDARVRLEVLDRLNRPGAPDLLTDRDSPDLYALGAHSAGLRSRLAGLAEGTVPAAAAAEATASLGAELTTVEQQMIDHAVRDVPTSMTGADPLHDAWDRLAVSRQRGILLALADGVELHPSLPDRRPGDGDVLGQTVQIRWRSPLTRSDL
jgi:site-specific DNA recombinase